jgi:glycogen operon protein
VWLRPDGEPPSPEDWNRPDNRTVIAGLTAGDTLALLVFHAGRDATTAMPPPPRPGRHWQRVLETAPGGGDNSAPRGGDDPASRGGDDPAPRGGGGLAIPPRGVTVFVETDFGEADDAASADATGTTRHAAAATDADVARLAGLAGIRPGWRDVEGRHHVISVETQRALLAAMRLPADTRDDCRDSLMRLTAMRGAALPPVMTVRDGEAIRVRLGTPRPAWVTLVREDGALERYAADADTLSLPPLPVGRHRLLLEDRPEQVCHLIVAPRGCYLPPELAAGRRRFGIAAHLYSLRNPAADPGIGDFGTLRRFAADVARTGAELLGLNPLHAMFPHDRRRISPYQPSDRRFLDPIYIDVSALPGGATPASPAPAPGPVDYPAVWARKRAVLRAAFDAAPRDHRPVPEALRRLAVHETICEVVGHSDWRSWPAGLRHPADPGVGAFAAQHAEDVGFHVFLQRLADRQLAEAAASAAAGGLSLGFYRDLAVGAAPDGAEAWSNQDTLMRGVSVGAPPDPFSTQGQVWSLPPPDPVAMQREGYAGFAALLEANMRHAGALRIDHVMGLQRLFVVPDGATAAHGAYVGYPCGDLLAQVALHSRRARCLIVGEDLGTVPKGFPEALAAENILSYSVLWFEREDGAIKPAAAWRQRAAACVSTHDLPTLAGWWEGADISERRALGLMDTPAAGAAMAERMRDKAALLALLRKDGLLAAAVDPAASPLPVAVAAAVHAFVSSTPAMLALVQADDLAGELAAVNLPGTDRERPNWQRRLAMDVDALFGTTLAAAILAAMRTRTSDRDA